MIDRLSISALEPLIDSDTTLRRAAETKVVLKELQDDLAACMTFFYSFGSEIHFFQAQRVTDLLRDKLYNQSSLLVEARDRVRELEEERRSLLGEFLQTRKEETHKSELFADVGEFPFILLLRIFNDFYCDRDKDARTGRKARVERAGNN